MSKFTIRCLAQLTLLASVALSFPQRQQSPVLYDDRTGKSYDQAYLASQVNQDLALVPRMNIVGNNEALGQPVMEERMGMGKKGPHHHRQPSHTMGPWMRYSQTYWNPFIYGGPNGPPTFVPSLGVWPTYNQGPEYTSHP